MPEANRVLCSRDRIRLAITHARSKLFYSVNRNEEETVAGANHLSRDLGTGEEIARTGATRAEKAMRSLRSILRTADRPPDRRRTLLGLPASQNQRMARFRPAGTGSRIIARLGALSRNLGVKTAVARLTKVRRRAMKRKQPWRVLECESGCSRLEQFTPLLYCTFVCLPGVRAVSSRPWKEFACSLASRN